MERADNLSVVPFSAGWSGLGGWDAVWREGDADQRGGVTSGPATALDCDDTMIRSESDRLEVVGHWPERHDRCRYKRRRPRGRQQPRNQRPSPRNTARGAGSKAS